MQTNEQAKTPANASLRGPDLTASTPVGDASMVAVARARFRRMGLAYLALLGPASVAVFASPDAGTHAFGLGLMMPGAGFLEFAAGGAVGVAMHVGLFLLTLAAFLFAWFRSGSALAPLCIWGGSALAAAAINDHETWPQASIVVPGLVLLIAVAAALASRRDTRAAIQRTDRRIG